MKIISRYVLKEHVGPFLFAATALTSIMLLQYIARNFSDLVGKGLPWRMIAEFFVLSVPLTVAMTLPMAVLVAVLYAWNHLSSENEITALRAGGVSSRRLLFPTLVAGVLMAIAMLLFNDQVLSRANHRLATLQMDIFRAKPTFAIREQVINTVKEGQLYLRATKVDEETSRMRDVVIYDLSDPTRRRTIYADTGLLRFAPNKRDLQLVLYHGVMQSAPIAQPGELTRLFFKRNSMIVSNVGTGEIKSSSADSTTKGDREMTVCEMQQQLTRYTVARVSAENEIAKSQWAVDKLQGKANGPEPTPAPVEPAGGIGRAYCVLIAGVAKVLRLPPPVTAPASRDSLAAAALLHRADSAAHSDSATHTDSATHADSAATQAAHAGQPRHAARVGPPPVNQPQGEAAAALVGQGPPPEAKYGSLGDRQSQLAQAKSAALDAHLQQNRYDIEIQKKFSLAATCIVFVLLGAPIALRFPRGGVGLVIGVSLLIFAMYYVGLIGGEALANRGIVSPFWAMWVANIILLLIAIPLLLRMGKESNTGRGGGEFWYKVRRRIRHPFARRGVEGEFA